MCLSGTAPSGIALKFDIHRKCSNEIYGTVIRMNC
jgi:hypothetical protein